MGVGQKLGAVATVLVMAMCVGACTGDEARSVEPQAAGQAQGLAVEYPKVITSKEGIAPAMTYEEFKVAGWGDLKGYGDRIATIRRTPRVEGDPTGLDLLDFKTGKTREVIAQGVSFSDGFDILSVFGSDRWIAWEEIKGDEQQAPLEVQWKLYAARIDADALTCGEPILVAESEVSMHTRPLFQVDGDRVYWMTNSSPNRRQEGAVHGAVVKMRDLGSEVEKTVCETGQHYQSMSVGDGMVVVSEMGVDSERVIVRVIDPDTGKETWTLDLCNEAELSHFPQVHDGAITWAMFTSDTLGYPDVYYRGKDGKTQRVKNGSSDPAMVGRYIFYDGIRVVRTGTGTSDNLCTLGGYDTVTNTTFELSEGEAEKGFWWQMPMGSGYRDDTFVVSQDMAPLAENPEAAAKASLVIRRYTVGGK